MMTVESNLEAAAARMVKLDAQLAIDAHIAAGDAGVRSGRDLCR